MKQREKKRIKINEDNLRDLWDNVKCPNIRITESQKKKTQRKSMGKYLRR